MDLSNDDLEQIAVADRREVDPPIQAETAMWSKAGQLDWWVRERRKWLGRVRGANGKQRWIKLLIFVPRAAHRPAATQRRRRNRWKYRSSNRMGPFSAISRMLRPLLDAVRRTE
jgi:hypothetical protein